MSVGNLPTQGDKRNNWTWQNSVLQLLGTISTNTGGAAGQDYELVTTTYKANKNGVGYSNGNTITRTQIYLMPAGTLSGTIWFNQSTGLTIVAPPIMDIDVVMPATAVTVNNLPLVLGQALMANSLAVTIASDQSPIPVTADRAAVSTNTAVARVTTAGGVVILAANTLRKGATIANASGAILYLKFVAIGTTSATSFTVRLVANAYYEVPFGYTGAISGIWASAGAGNALISELT